MAITLSQLCYNTATKYNMHLAAGRRGMGNTVRWVHMIEDRQVPEFLHGNELVFTTGIGHVGSDPLLDFVKKLNEYRAAGVVINIGPYLSHIPEDVIDYCNQTDFPIFTIPWQTYIIDVIYDLCRRIIENEESEAAVSEVFKKLITAPETWGEVSSELERQGFSNLNSYTVLSLRFLKEGKNVTSQFVELHILQLWNLLAKATLPAAMFMMQERLVIIRQNTSQNLIAHLEASLAKAMAAATTGYAMGVSSEEKGFERIPELLRQADSARITAEMSNNKKFYYNDIGINKLLLGINDHPDILRSVSEEYLNPILAYDRENGTELARLLYEYLMLDGSVQAVADRLGLHRNTVNSRMKQIKQLFRFELTGQKKTELLLAFLAKEVADYMRLNGGN